MDPDTPLPPLCFCPDERGCGAVAWIVPERSRLLAGSPGPVMHVWVECFANHTYFLPERYVVLMD